MKDIYCSYYTNSDEITSYMVNSLELKNDEIILEPSAGEGVFIDEVLNTNHNLRIDALDINIDSIKLLGKKYKGTPNISVRHVDTLFDFELDNMKKANGFYDKIIGNPPYGAWQDYEKRDLLKKKYAGYYVKETYTLFLLRCLSLLKENGKLSFIIPDTFLFLNMHKKLRETLLCYSSIEQILIFPSKFFPGVSFGYSNLSIITLKRTNEEESLKNIVRVIKGFKEIKDLSEITVNKLPNHLITYELKQKDILKNKDFKFILAEEKQHKFINSDSTKLEDIANIVTGFYSGDNKKFIRRLDTSSKEVKGYEKINSDKVFDCKSVYGIQGVEEGYIKYLKGSSKKTFVKDDNDWVIRWDSKTIEFYKNNKKSRFQNSEYYFNKGISVPMVKSKKIKATLIAGDLFDQSIVGVFPKEEKYLYYILAFFNTDICNKLIHIINPTANNSANYVKQIPIIIPKDEILLEINNKVIKILELKTSKDYVKAEKIEKELNLIIEDIYKNYV